MPGLSPAFDGNDDGIAQAQFSIRPANGADAPFVLALYSQPHVRSQLHPPANLDDVSAAIARPKTEHLIVERAGKPFGSIVLDTGLDWMLTILALAMSQPRCGAGRFALEYAIAHGFDELRVHRIFLEVLSSNRVARSLYERLGFRSEGFYRDGFRDEHGAYHNLVPYGMLASDRRTAPGPRDSIRGTTPSPTTL